MRRNTADTHQIYPPLRRKHTDWKNLAFWRFVDLLSVPRISYDIARVDVNSPFQFFRHCSSLFLFSFIPMSLPTCFTIRIFICFFSQGKKPWVILLFLVVSAVDGAQERLAIELPAVQLFPCYFRDPLWFKEGKNMNFSKTYISILWTVILWTKATQILLRFMYSFSL